MRAVYKRELASCFRHIRAYIVIALSTVMSAIVLSANNLTYTLESIGSVVSFMSLVAVLTVPVVAAGCLRASGKRGASPDEAYAALPLRSRDVAAGKYLAALTVLAISDIALLFCPILSGLFGEVDHLASYTAIFGYALLQAAWLAVCVFIFKAVKKRVIAYAVAYGAIALAVVVSAFIPYFPQSAVASFVALCVLAALLGALAGAVTRRVYVGVALGAVCVVAAIISYFTVPERFAGLFERTVCAVLPIDRFNPFTDGIFDLSGVIYFISLTAAFLWLFVRLFKTERETREDRPCMDIKKPASAAAALVLCIALVAVNVAAWVAPRRFTALDATISNKASVSDEAKEYLSGIDKDVTFYLLEPVSSDISNAVATQIYRLYLDRLIATNDRFELVEVRYGGDPPFYEERGISHEAVAPNSLIIECGDRMEYVNYYSLLMYSNTELSSSPMTISEYQYMQQLFSSNEQYAEYLYSLVTNTTVYNYADMSICSVVEYVTADIIPTNYYLTGHGEPSSTEVTSPFYQWGLPTLDTTATSEIPKDAASILINMPATDISESEAKAFLDYLSCGGQLTFVTAEANLDMPNLCSVLSAYGMSVQTRGAVNEPAATEDGEAAEQGSTEFAPTVNFNNDIFGELDGTGSFAPAVKNANAITVNTDGLNAPTVSPLLSSSAKSYIGDDPSKCASYTLACAVETSDGAKVVWFTGGEAFNREDTASLSALAYALTWVTLEYESETSALPPTLYRQPTVPIVSGGATFITVALCVAAAATAAFGVVNIYRRKKAK